MGKSPKRSPIGIVGFGSLMVYRRWGISPRPEDYLFSLLYAYLPFPSSGKYERGNAKIDQQRNGIHNGGNERTCHDGGIKANALCK